MAREKIAGLPIERNLTIAQAVAVTLALGALKPGKVEKPKDEKPKFRPVLKRNHDAAPGQCRELENNEGFRQLCRRAGVSPSRRQASKYLQRRGVAYRYENR